MTTATTTKPMTILEELARYQGMEELPTDDSDKRDLVKLILKDCPEANWPATFSDVCRGYLAIAAKIKRGRKQALPLPPDEEEKDIVPDMPDPKPAKDADIIDEAELIPYDFKCEENPTKWDIDYILDLHTKSKLAIPELQRQVVWKRASQELFLESIFSSIPIDEITIANEADNMLQNVLDGLQRFTSILLFRDNLIQVKLGDGNRYFFQDLPKLMQDKFLQRKLKVNQITCARKFWPLIFRLKNMGGVALNQYEGRRGFWIADNPLIKLIDTVTSPTSLPGGSPTGDLFCEMFGGNNRYKGHGAVHRALYLAGNAEHYEKPMATALDNHCQFTFDNPLSKKELSILKGRLELTINSLKESLANKAFRLDGSRTNNLGLVDAMFYGSILFQEAGIDNVEDLGAALKELRKRLLNSNIVRFGLKDDTSSNNSVRQRFASIKIKADNIVKKRDN